MESLKTSLADVPRIAPPRGISQDWLQGAFSRLHLWGMEGFDQVTYLGSDAFLMSANAGQVFEVCEEDLCAMECASAFVGHDDDEVQLLSAGALVVRPNHDKFDCLVNVALPEHKCDPCLDEALLSEVLLSSARSQKMGAIKLLPWARSACSFAFFKERGERLEKSKAAHEKASTLGHIDCFQPLLGSAPICHHCGASKLSNDGLCLWEGINEPSSHCELEHVKVLQELLVEANPCALGGQPERWLM